MNNNEKNILEQQLNKIYKLMDQVDKSKVRGTTEYRVVYELEQINMGLDIPFND